MQNYFNELYSMYANGQIERGDFEGLIYQYLMKNQEKTCLCHWTRDEYEDFVSWFYPRLKKAIDAYREKGASFESFIGKVLRVTGKEYRGRVTTNGVIEYSAWCVQVPELYAHEDPPPYLTDKAENIKLKMFDEEQIKKKPKQLMALLLKCYYFVSDDLLDRIALATGMEREKLREMIDKLREKRQKKDDEIYRLKERIYCQYYRCIVYEKRLLLTTENTVYYSRLKSRIEKARQRLEKMRNRLAVIRTTATNREVAEIIGISKGAVDATLHSLKTKCGVTINGSILN